MTDDQLLAYIAQHPGVRLRGLCAAFDVPWRYMPAYRAPARTDCGYTVEAKALRNQLQRLRRERLVKNRDGGWCLTEGAAAQPGEGGR